MYIEQIVENIIKLNNIDVCKTNAYQRTVLGLKAVNSSIPWNEGSRTVTLENGHNPFGYTKLYTPEGSTLNLLTALVSSTELDEDIALLNKPIKPKYRIKIKKEIPDDWTLVRKTPGKIKKGDLIATGPESFDEIRASISGHLHISLKTITITSESSIATNTKIQNLFLQKHVIKNDFNRYKFVNTEKYKITEETLENLKQIGLIPKVVNVKNLQPTLIAGSTSVIKRRSTGTLAQMWLGYNLMKNTEKYKNETEHSWNKIVYVTKVYDNKHKKYQDAMVGIVPWLVAINSGGYEYKLSTNKTDEVGRYKNSVSIDPFGYKVLELKYPELADTFLKHQLKCRIKELKKVL